MTDEIKPPTQQVPPEGSAAAGAPPAVVPPPVSLVNLTEDQLKALYAKSPDLFKKAGIVKEEAPPPPKEQQSAAPADPFAAVKLPDDIPLNKEVVARYLSHAKEVGLSPEQAQKEINFQAEEYRRANPKPVQKTPQQIDAENVAILKADKDFGGTKFDENMKIAQEAAKKHGDAELLERLKTTDPVLVRHFWKLGLKDRPDNTPNGGQPRNGNETADAKKREQEGLRARYPQSQQMFKGNPNQ